MEAGALGAALLRSIAEAQDAAVARALVGVGEQEVAERVGDESYS